MELSPIAEPPGDGHSSKTRIFICAGRLANHYSINLVVAAIFAPVYLFLLPSVDPQPGRRKTERFAGLDFGG